ncbi:outer membrane beta-barrel protein [Undibacterium sp. Dicai25W]|uniref:outer membrane beta-barrel protein n=1 Tax=Undibacterium sp. Dicai25W TaxID=3413034 RepID=UPI003BF133EB
MFNTKTMSAVVALFAFTFSANSMAQAYVGGTVGQARWETSCSQASFCDTYDTSFSVLGGYHFNANWGTEASYTSLGTIHASSYTATGPAAASIKAKGFDLSGVYRHQIMEKVEGFAKVGIAFTKAETNGYAGGWPINGSLNSTKPVFGFGATYAITPRVALRAEISSRKVDMTTTTSTTANNFSIGLQAGF